MVTDVWPVVRRERIALADDLKGLTEEQWVTPSLCGGWRVRDVVAHLVWLAESSARSAARDALRYPGTVNRSVDKAARDEARLPTDELCDRLRAAADGRFKAPMLPPAVALAEVVIHGEDACRPLEISRSIAPEDLRPCLDLYGRIGFVVARSRRARKVRLDATDLDWSRGDGPDVRGPSLELLLVMAGRTAAVDGLEGPGVAVLRGT